MIKLRYRKQKLIWFGVGITFVILVVCTTCWYFLEKSENTMMAVNIVRINKDIKQGQVIKESDINEDIVYVSDKEQLTGCEVNVIGSKAGISIKAGNVVTTDMIYSDVGTDDDLRYQKFSGINTFKGITVGSLVDVRVKFANGEDYIVINHKTIESIEDDGGLVMKVNEEEILRMSSAQVDVNRYTGTEVYVVKYVQEYQKPSQSYYPLNDEVITLAKWDPNIVDKVFGEEERKQRNRLEGNVCEYLVEKKLR